MSKTHLLQVKAVERLTEESVVLTLDVPESVKGYFQYLPGQYVSLETTINGETVRRSYSLCSSPHSGLLQVGIKEVSQGLFSTYANQKLGVGETLKVGLPEGRFTLDTKKSTPLMAVAAGSGITPILSIIKSAIHQDSKTPIVLVYGNKSPEKTMFYETLRQLEKEHPKQIKIHWIFSEATVEGAHFGRIDASLLKYALNQTNTVPKKFFLCGPEPMIRLSEQFLSENEIGQNQIHFELFTTSSAKEAIANTAKKGELQITCDEVTHKLDLVPNKTLLDIALQAKLDVPYSCQGGVCSSCIGKITSGQASMISNQILTDEEVAEGLVLTCQALAKSEHISVDYDDV
ncbi:MAG: ferredoxin--NADP reductase [Flavobacteriaceae bacterium]